LPFPRKREPPKESFEEAGYGSNGVFVRWAIWTKLRVVGALAGFTKVNS
jgi:hypothetical protein